jgi:DnaD/phage-associated family protein
LQAFEVFAQADKAYYDPKTGVVWVKNMFKFQANSSPKLAARIAADIRAVPECALKDEALRYLAERLPIGYGSGSGTSLSVSVSGSGSVSLSVSEGEGVQGEREAPDSPQRPITPRDGQVWEAYERNIGAMTPLVAESLGDDEREYGAEWVCAAIQEAVKHEARNLKYVEAILARWKRDGFRTRSQKPSTARGSPRAGRKSAAEVHEMLEQWVQE